MAIITEIRRKLPLLPRAHSADEPPAPDRVLHLPVEDIIPNRHQPRSAFHQNAIARLAESIRRYGVLQPLTVRKVLPPTTVSGAPSPVYELIAGERRLRAARLAGLCSVPCLIVNTDDATSAELAVVENLLREDLNMFEQAEAFSRLIHEFHLTQEEAARRVSMSQSAVANKLRILRLLPEERERILSAGLTERHARALLKLSDPSLRADALAYIVERRLNVSASEAYIDRILDDLTRFQAKNEKKDEKIFDFCLNDTDLIQDGTQNAPTPTVAQESEHPVQATADTPEGSLERSCTPAEAPHAVRRPRFKGCIQDLQPFYNSIRNAVSILEQVGIVGDIQKTESENEIRLTVTLTRGAAG